MADINKKQKLLYLKFSLSHNDTGSFLLRGSLLAMPKNHLFPLLIISYNIYPPNRIPYILV